MDNCIDFCDIPDTPTKDPIDYLPPELQKAGRALPIGQAHTVLTLPPEGGGHNAGLLQVASICHKMGVDFDDTLSHLQDIYSTDRVDYHTAPERAVKRIWQAGGDISKLIDDEHEAAPDRRDENLLRFRRLAQTEIVEASPAPVKADTYDILKALFSDKDLINIQHTAFEYGTIVPLGGLPQFLSEKGADLSGYKFLNPATFKKSGGVPNPLNNDKVSTRCNANVKSREWVVLEIDHKDTAMVERFNAFAIVAAAYMPLTLAIDTGGKSTHYWFDGRTTDKTTRRSFFNIACLHGADKRLGVKSQIARMPNVPAEKEGRGPQQVIYFDPEAGETQKWDLRGFEAHLQKNKQLDYYYHKGNNFYTRDNLETWIHLDRVSLRSHLAQQGYRDAKIEGELLAPMDLVINTVQMEKNVMAVISGASGRHSGVYEENGERVIVTKSPELIKPRKGKWNTIDKFLTGMLDGTPDQKEIFFGWLSAGVRDFRNDGKRRAIWSPAQMVHLAGSRNAGKTLILKVILTPLFGGRAACADPLFKKTPDMHNADTFGCELLYLDDSPVLETSHHFRQEFGERIKSHVVGVGGGLREMRQSRINMRPWWRFVRLMNLEPATLATVPPLDDGIADKLIILRAESMKDGPLGSRMEAPGWFDQIEAEMSKELPAFLHYLLSEFTLPKHLKCPDGRYPTLSYIEPTVREMLAEGSAETSILHKIDGDAAGVLFNADECMFAGDDEKPELKEWRGSAVQLYDLLLSSGSRVSQNRFAKMCPSPRVLVSQLRSLEKTNPERIGYSERRDDLPTKLNGVKYWVIFPREEEKINIEDLI